MARRTAKKPNRKAAKKPAKARKVLLLAATRKGLWIFHGDAARKKWRVDGPHYLGNVFHHAVLDPRDGRTILAAAKTGHLGPTVFRSTDVGKTWKESARPPAFPKVTEPAPNGLKGRTVDHTFWLTPGHAAEPNVWYAGTSPQGIFRSEDGGVSWEPLDSFNENPTLRGWFGAEQDGTPNGPKLHSLIIDPRDARHMYIGMSGGGVHESTDKGRTWRTLIKGMEVVQGFDLDPANPTCHDPHCMRLAPSNPDRLYQQNHCGIYRLYRPGETWDRIGRSMPKNVGDVGFPMVVHPRDDKTCWVFPMDGSGVWPRVSPEGKPAAYVTRDGGRKWQRLDSGLPRTGWWTVKRQAMTADAGKPVGLYFGTTSGELWASSNEGKKWVNIVRHLPEIYSVEAAGV